MRIDYYLSVISPWCYLAGQRLEGIAGTVRPIGRADDHGTVEVYYRPPPKYLEPRTLLRVLLKRLVDMDAVAASPAR